MRSPGVPMKRKVVFLTVVAALSCRLISAAHAENWPCFRGPTRQGISHEQNVPTSWTATSGITWKVAVPGEGVSSPIVFESRVYVTAAQDEGASLRLICLGVEKGDLIWNKELVQQKTGHKSRQNSFATSTPATDGRRIYAVSCDGRVVAVTMEGEHAWTNADFDYYSEHGLAVSPVLYDDLAIVAYDWSSPGPDKKLGWQVPWDKSLILALETSTGRARWQGRRGSSRIAHVTPLIVNVDGVDQLVSGAGDVVQGFDLQSGQRLWSVSCPGEGVVPSVVGGDGMVFTTSGFGASAIRGIRPGGAGQAQIVWESADDVPKVPSMLYVSPYLYLVSDSGVARCLKGPTGEEVWKARLRGKFSASPVWAAGKVYLLSENGTMTVIEAGPQFKVLVESEVGEKCYASIAVSQGRLFIRAEKHLFCIASD